MPWILSFRRIWLDGREDDGYVYVSWAVWRERRKRGWL